MDIKRIKAITRLFLLFGLPVLLVFGIFSCGVYCGSANRHTITKFERNWLGLNVEIAAEPDDEGKDKDEDEEKDKDKEKDEDADEDKEKDEGKDEESADPPKDEGAQDDKPDETPVPAVVPVPLPTATTAPEDKAEDKPDPLPTPVPVPEAAADPLEGELAKRLALPVTVTVKVIVDQELIDRHDAWIDYVQRNVSQASQIYRKQFGVELELVSVGRWAVPTAGLSSSELLEDLRSRPREGADVLVGFTNRPLDGATAGKAEPPRVDDEFNGAYGVIYAVPEAHNPHLRTLLHEVGHMFGALDVTDESSAAFKRGSWMGYAPVDEAQAPWVDTENRERILGRKDKPFRPEEKKK